MSSAILGRDERIHSLRWLCRLQAARFVRPGLERADLEQVAMIGLIKATDRYNEDFGIPFTYFAKQRIIGELMHYVRDHETLVRFPRMLYGVHRREQKAHARLQLELGRQPTDAEVASAIDCTTEDLHRLRLARYRCSALDYDAVHEYSLPGNRIDERAMIFSSLETLERDEQAILMAVYGLRLSQTEAGMRLGYTQRSASRLHKRALQKLSCVLGET